MKKAFFDTVQYKGGKFYFLKEHLDRISYSAKKYGIQRARVRFVLEPFPFFPPGAYKKGIRLVFSKTVRSLKHPLALHKTEPRPHMERAKKEAARRHADEIVLLSKKGCVTECSTSNIFAVKQGRLYTAPLNEGILSGVTRRKVIQLAKRLKIPCRQLALKPDFFYEADEIFITSALKDILPVRELEGRRPKEKVPGPLTRQLMKAFQKILY